MTQSIGPAAADEVRAWAGDRPVTGIFKFNILKRHGRNCPKGTLKRFTRAYRFEGGMRIENRKAAPRGLSGRCNKAPGHRKLYPHTSVFTATAQDQQSAK